MLRKVLITTNVTGSISILGKTLGPRLLMSKVVMFSSETG